MSDGETLAERLREARHEAQLTLEGLSKAAGVSVRGISDIERGVSRSPQLGTLQALAKGLGLDGSGLKRLASNIRGSGPSDDVESAFAPVLPHDFTGRTDELARLRRSATQGVPSIIVGPPGIGKTILAIAALNGGDSAEESTQLFVDLRGVGSAPLTPLAVVQRLIRQLAPDSDDVPNNLQSAVDRWRQIGSGRRIRLLLDNADNEAQVRPALVSGGDVATIVTSRRALGGLEGLDRMRLAALTTSEGISMLERILPAHKKNSADLRALVELCDGIPLALRIAGNRLASRPNESARDFVQRLRSEERRLRLLVSGDLSVEAAFSVSYGDLNPKMAMAFRRLAVIEGSSFDSAYAAAAAGVDVRNVDMDSLLDDLVDLGLLESLGGLRYRLHDLVRLFAAARLRDDETQTSSSHRDRLHQWVLATFASALSEWSPSMGGVDHLGHGGVPFDPLEFEGRCSSKNWIVAEADHWWPAYEAAAARGDNHTVWALSEGFRWFSDVWPDWANRYELHKKAVEAAREAGDNTALAIHLNHLNWAAVRSLGDPGLAIEHSSEALAAAEATGDQLLVIRSHYQLAWTYVTATDPAAAEPHIRFAIDGFRLMRSHVEEMQARAVNGNIQRMLGRLDVAAAELRTVLADLGADSAQRFELGIMFAQTVAFEALVRCELALRNIGDALEVAGRQVALAETIPSEPPLIRALLGRAQALYELGRVADSRSDLGRAAELIGSTRVDPISMTLRAELTVLLALVEPAKQEA